MQVKVPLQIQQRFTQFFFFCRVRLIWLRECFRPTLWTTARNYDGNCTYTPGSKTTFLFKSDTGGLLSNFTCIRPQRTCTDRQLRYVGTQQLYKAQGAEDLSNLHVCFTPHNHKSNRVGNEYAEMWANQDLIFYFPIETIFSRFCSRDKVCIIKTNFNILTD